VCVRERERLRGTESACVFVLEGSVYVFPDQILYTLQFISYNL
jgi:hypothetical protein